MCDFYSKGDKDEFGNDKDCHYLYDCCDCGNSEDGCGCPYCYSCNACDDCLNEDNQ